MAHNKSPQPDAITRTAGLKRSRAQDVVMDEVQKYLEHHRSRLLRYLDGEAPATIDEPDAQTYIDIVLDEWRERFSGAQLPEPESEEMTFWFALYKLEELTEFPSAGNLDPYEAVLMKNLSRVRELLRKWRPLPREFIATRPDGR